MECVPYAMDMSASAMNLRPRLYWSVALAPLLVVPALSVSMYAFQQLEAASLRHDQTQAIIADANGLLSSLKDAESGQRGFLLTENTAFLAPYQDALVNIPAQLRNLQVSSRLRGSAPLVDDLVPSIDAKLIELAKVLALHSNGEANEARKLIGAGVGKAIMDDIRVKVGLIVERDTVQLGDHFSQLQSSFRQMFWLIIAAASLWMLFLLWFIYLLYRRFEGQVDTKVMSRVHLETVNLFSAQTDLVEELTSTNAALNDSKALFETVLNAVDDCVIRVRAEDNLIEYTNVATQKLLGYEGNGLLGRPLSLILPDMTSEISPFLEGEHEVLGRRFNGETLIFSMSVNAILQSDRRFFICTLRDCTERDRIMTALRESDLALHNGIAIAGLGLGTVDYLADKISLDEVSADFFDLPAGTPISRTDVHGRFHPDDLATMQSKIAISRDPFGHGFMAMEFRVTKKDGSLRWLTVRKQVVFGGNGDDRKPVSAVVALRDITVQKLSAIELAAAKQVAETANAAKSRFLSNMSHELRTPLNAILGFAQLAATSSSPLSDKQQKNIDQIQRAGWYLLELINEILDLAMIESGKLTLSIEPTDLTGLFLECQEMMEPQGKGRDVLLVFRPPGSPYHIHADRTRLKQVLLNLLSNAIKYNRKGGTVVVSCAVRDAKVLRISVADTGLGLAKEQLDQLFEAFNRLGQEAFSEEGTGLGLALSKHLIGLMGGHIGAESTVGTGSIFWIDIGFSVPAPLLLTTAPSAPTHDPLPNAN